MIAAKAESLSTLCIADPLDLLNKWMDEKPDKPIFTGSDSQAIHLVPELLYLKKNSILPLLRRNKRMPSSCSSSQST
jgi:hypothetical protein